MPEETNSPSEEKSSDEASGTRYRAQTDTSSWFSKSYFDHLNTSRFFSIGLAPTSLPRRTRARTDFKRKKKSQRDQNLSELFSLIDRNKNFNLNIKEPYSKSSAEVFAVDPKVYNELYNSGIVGSPLPIERKKKETENPEVELEPAGSSHHCLICLGKETKKKELIILPCSKRCNESFVHTKCIFEWKEAKRGKNTCPLCRSPIGFIYYNPPDVLQFRTISKDNTKRREFVLRPLPKEAGMIRAYIKVKQTGNINPMLEYEFYLQSPVAQKYPRGPLPDRSSPYRLDLLLLRARKAKTTWKKINSVYFSLCSTIDIFMDNNTKSVLNRKSENYLGYVQATGITGLEYTMRIKNVNSLSAFIRRTPSSSSKTKKVFDKSRRNLNLVSKYKSKFKRTKPEFIDAGMIAYVQNRFGANSGPRKMKICLPGVEKITPGGNGASVRARLYSDLAEEEEADESDEDDDDVPLALYRTSVLSPPKKGILSKFLKSPDPCKEEEVKNSEVLFGKNLEPQWLESIEAYSLDFHGRVTLPSNKNFQIELKSSYAVVDDIRLQFGKVDENTEKNESIYTIDFQWPLSPIQALAICLSSCDRKLGCA
eukprot:augustus_masked-scaffold_15-processed-gene-9.43-mRNA-1 protein AED:0.43 eAED:0.43 QI:0/-1/0/1/-1/1/1/0/594